MQSVPDLPRARAVFYPLVPMALTVPLLADARFPWPMRLLHSAARTCRSPQGSPSELQAFQQIQRRTRRHRTIFTEDQLQALETLFHQNQYPDVITREHLANRIHLKEERVEVRSCSPVRCQEEHCASLLAVTPGEH